MRTPITTGSLSRVRAATVRRAIAVVCVLAAAALFVARPADGRDRAVVVAARDLRPGVVLSDDDLRVTRVPRDVALGALHEKREATGSRLTGAVAAGEALTATRLLGSRLPAAVTGDPRARLVPVRPADAAVTGLLRSGDVVDVLDEDAHLLAAGAVVAVPAAPPRSAVAAADAPVLLAMGEDAAHRVAAAGLANALTLVIH
ncbi:SAF domain-containing protein [Gordonia sp. (in: high G+C Gram-positive bacteria)]|uniref:SAF domain-containing protein n=1 Tax=Gordonia sp. (in: high G+C Gram-positive bacteria) TaxID=84139 RepID=UPI0026102EF3|nr:SAF domain-containing protein [Gordonia sp. (in: high G+C Gram-positive bacteria)]